MSRVKPGPLYRSRSMREPMKFGSGSDLSFRAGKGKLNAKCSGVERITSVSMDNIILSADSLEEWLLPTSSGFRRTEELQCLLVSDESLRKIIDKQQKQQQAASRSSLGSCSQCECPSPKAAHRHSAESLGQSDSFEVTRRVEIEEVRKSPSISNVPNVRLTGKSKTSQQLQTASLVFDDVAGDIQLRRCISLYERTRTPHYCTNRHHVHPAPPSPSGHFPRYTSKANDKVSSHCCSAGTNRNNNNNANTKTSLRRSFSSSGSISPRPSCNGSYSRSSSRLSLASGASSSDIDISSPTKPSKSPKQKQRKCTTEPPKVTSTTIKELNKRSSIPRPVQLEPRRRAYSVEGPPSRKAWGINGHLTTGAHSPGETSKVTKSVPSTPCTADDNKITLRPRALQNGQADKLRALRNGQGDRPRALQNGHGYKPMALQNGQGDRPRALQNGQGDTNGYNSSSTETLNDIPPKLKGHIVLEDEDGYPEPMPTSKLKHEIYNPKDFVNVDNHAIETPKSLTDNFDELIDYLLEDLTSDVSKVRSIYQWVTSQTLPLTSPVGFRDTDTPRGFLFSIRERRATYPELFALLCRRARVPCVIIYGIAKSVIYDVGDKVSKKRGKNSWNAVLIDDEWRFVHPYWGAHTVSGYKTGRWAVVESDKHHKEGYAPNDVGYKKATNDFYFLTDPDKFIIRCFPEDAPWQLLPKHVTKSEFEALPFLQAAFHEFNLKDVSHDTCTVHTKKGKAEFELEIGTTVEKAKSYKFGYNLFERRDFEAEGEYDVTSLERYFLHYKFEDRAYFQIRFPVVGVFKLELHCADAKQTLPTTWICDYKIVCSEISPNCQPLPVVPEPEIGWGPGEVLESMGIECLTHEHPIVCMDKEIVTFLRFALPKDKTLEFEADLVTNYVPRDALKSNVTLEQDGDHVVIQVTPPGEGEYVLQIYVREDEGRRNVCNYLMQRTKIVEDPELADIRNELVKATESGDVDSLSHWIEKFNERGMDDAGDLVQARKKLQVGKLNRDIQEAISRRDLDLLERTLHSASSTSLRRQLGDLVNQAEAMRSRLRRFKRLQHDVLAMDQKTISEIRSYPKPPPAVHAVMAATFLLLGNKEGDLKKWTKIQGLISKRGKDSLKRRVSEFSANTVTHAVLLRVHRILSKYDLETVQVASVGAATFYQWAFTMAAEVEEKEEEA